jgi:uncharacterized membrane protein YhiD involved in acid resistance
MMAMTPSLGWTDVALRLALTVGASILLGYNRSEHGKAAGMRTTLLVCLAASVAMLQVNALLPTAGRASNSFVMNDLMRLPLGILTGVGFIGGGAILSRGDMVVGVTTAATLWLATVIGLCLGGGQIGLGLANRPRSLCPVGLEMGRERVAAGKPCAPLAHGRCERPWRSGNPAPAERCRPVDFRKPSRSKPR